MKIGALVHMYPPLHNAGAEHMLHAILSEGVRRGHTCVVCPSAGEGSAKVGFKPYTHDGVRVSEDMRILNHCDILVTHLDRTTDAEKLAEVRDIPLVHLFHNHERPATVQRCDLAVYNSNWLLKASPCDAPSIMIHPPVWEDVYRVDNTDAKHITLINLSKPKGAEMFYALAKLMPQQKFLGVKGAYGKQILPSELLPNVTILPTQRDIRNVYRQTKILLMPSSYESYGRCAVEAAVSGIPTIAHPTPGLREALADYGTFPVPDSPSWKCAIEYVLDTYPARVMDAKWIARNLDPAGDVTRLLDAFQDTITNYKKRL